MFGLSDRILTMLNAYFEQQPELQEVWVYGSRAMGRERPGSDIDLAIVTTSGQDLAGHIKTDLEDLSTPYTFDVIDYNRISHQPLKDHINRVKKKLYAKDPGSSPG